MARVRDVMTKKYTDEQKLLIKIHRIWRIINWAIIVLLANMALSKLLNWLRISRTGVLSYIFLVGSITFAGVMVAYAEDTAHDRIRRRNGWIALFVSEAISLAPVAKDTAILSFFGIVNAVTEKIGGEIFNVENYENSNLGWFWWLKLIFAGLVCISLLLESQSTDRRMSFMRTPPKKDITDINRNAIDDEGNKIIRIRQYKQ